MSLTTKQPKQNNEKKLVSGMNVGSSSILVTFVLLCLVTFAALSYVSANSDYKLSLETSNRSKAYYKANGKAELKLAEIESILIDNWKNSSSKREYYDSIDSLFCNDELVECENNNSDTFLSYSIPISEIQKLNIVLKVNYPENENKEFFTIVKWQNNSTYSEEDLINETQPNLLF